MILAGHAPTPGGRPEIAIAGLFLFALLLLALVQRGLFHAIAQPAAAVWSQ